MGKIVLRILAGILAIFSGAGAYLHYTGPVDNSERIIGITLITLCFFMLYQIKPSQYRYKQHIDNDDHTKMLMEKTLQFGMLVSLICILGYVVYSYFAQPREFLFGMSALSVCFIMLHYAVTGNRRPFFPKLGPLFPKKKHK